MKENNSNKLNSLNYIIIFAIILFIIVLSVYFYNFNFKNASNNNDWGAFGDFVGGTLNPIFGLFSLFAIIYTIKIQTQELEYSRKELESTREELAKSSEAQQEQSKAFDMQNKLMQKQTFENTFFRLLKLYDDSLNSLQNEYLIENKSKVMNKSQTISILLNNINDEINAKNQVDLQNLLGNKDIDTLKSLILFNIKGNKNLLKVINSIFIIMSLIHNSGFITDIDKKFYISIIKLRITEEEKVLILYFTYIEENNIYKLLLDKYNFFENIDINLLYKGWDTSGFYNYVMKYIK